MKIKNLALTVMLVVLAGLTAIAAAVTAPVRWYWTKTMEAGQFKTPVTRAAMAVNSQQVVDATITITQSASGTWALVVQMLGTNGKALTAAAMVGWYLSTDDAGQVMAVTSTDVTSLAAGTDGMIMEDNVSGNVWGNMMSEDDGDVDVAIVVPASKTVYLNLIMPDGRVVHSAIMTYGM